MAGKERNRRVAREGQEVLESRKGKVWKVLQ
jgi:hypothetical protein